MTPLGDRIQLYFRFQGQKCRPTLDLKPTPPNLMHARRLVVDIEARVRAGTFDLGKEFPTYKGLARFGVTPKSPETFRHYGELWLSTKGKLSPSTVEGYRKILKFHWYKWCGDKLISTILPSEVKVNMGSLTSGRKTHNNILDPGRQVFELALGDGAIKVNPCDGIDYLELPDSEPDPYDLREVDLILPKIRERWGEEMYDYFEYAFFSGLRPSEQIEERWDLDIDMVARTARIQRARVRKTVKDTKTYYNRTVEHHSRAYAALERQFARTGLEGKYVWMSPFSGNGRKRGEPWLDEHRQGGMFRAVIKLLKIRPRPAKNTRHTYATMLLMAGAKPAWAATQMGHSLQMFMARYAKWIPGGDNGTEIAKVEAFTGAGSIPEVSAVVPSTGQTTGQKPGKIRFHTVK